MEAHCTSAPRFGATKKSFPPWLKQMVRRTRFCESAFATVVRESNQRTSHTCSIRFLQPKITERASGCRLCMELFRNTAAKSKSKANSIKVRHFISCSHWCASTERWRLHDGPTRLCSIYSRL